ncbi:MAG: hypothetical protein WC050_02465 [Candidatus Paceibacterota bacterium]
MVKPSAWLPVLLSLGIWAMLFYRLAVFGIVRGGDEGVAAHLFQIWIPIEALMLAFFAIKWLPRAPKPALTVLAIQVAVALVPVVVVFSLQL